MQFELSKLRKCIFEANELLDRIIQEACNLEEGPDARLEYLSKMVRQIHRHCSLPSSAKTRFRAPTIIETER